MHSPIEELEDTAQALLQMSNLLIRELSPLFRRASLTPQQWAVLSEIARADEAPTLAAISRAMRVSKQNVTGMITRIESLGLVVRREDDRDLRATRLELTRKGRQVHQRIQPRYEAWLLDSVGRLSAAERELLTSAVSRLTQR